MLHFANMYCCTEIFNIICLRDNREVALPLSFTCRPIEIQHCSCLSHCYISSNRDRETALHLSCSLLHYTNRDRDGTARLMLTATLYQQRQRDSTAPLLLLHLANRHRETALPVFLSPPSHCNTIHSEAQEEALHLSATVRSDWVFNMVNLKGTALYLYATGCSPWDCSGW